MDTRLVFEISKKFPSMEIEIGWNKKFKPE